jgi:hypothetical protein
MAPLSAAVGGYPKYVFSKSAQIVQGTLNRFPVPCGGPARKLATDGKCGNATLEAIRDFQLRLGFKKPDRRVDVKGRTYKALAAGPNAMQTSGELYRVPNVPLIPQTLSWACWYAATQMLIQWKRIRTRSTLADHPSPSDIPQMVRIHIANNGLGYSQVVQLAQRLGLRVVYPRSVPLQTITSMLQRHGPLWTHGKTHVVVIAGVNEARDQVYVHDPAPVNVGRKEWRSYTGGFVLGNAPGSQPTSANVEASFLYHP